MKRIKSHIIGSLLLIVALMSAAPLYAYKIPELVITCDAYIQPEEVQNSRGSITVTKHDGCWQVTATPKNGWKFKNWSDLEPGDEGYSSNPRQISNLSELSETFTANFQRVVYNCHSGEEYIISIYNPEDDPYNDYDYGTIDTVTVDGQFCIRATAKSEHTFVQWADGSYVNPRPMVSENISDTTFFATFIPQAFRGTISEWNMNGFTITLGISEPTFSDTLTLFYDGVPVVERTIIDHGLGIYSFRVAYDAGDLAGKNCHIVFKNKKCEPIATLEAVIPYLVSGLETITELDSYTPVHVLTGGTATISAPELETFYIGPLDIYAGGQAIIDGEGTVSAGSVTMRADWPNTVGVPDLLVNGSLVNRSSNIINFDYNLNWYKFYGFAVPYTVNSSTSDINYTSGPTAMTSYVLGIYDGEKRAQGDGTIGWTKYYDYAYGDGNYRPTAFTPRKGYYIYGDPELWRNFEDENYERDASPFRFPISVDLTSPEEAASIYVTQYGNELTDISNKNWNLLGSPYLTAYSGTIEMWKDEAYVADLKYISIPQNGNVSDCSAEEVSRCILEPFTPFFVQFEEDVNILKFAAPTASTPSPAPAKRLAKAAQTPEEVAVGITLKQNGLSDHTGIYISEQYTNNYDVNADLAKMIGESERIKLYSLLGSTKLAYMALPPVNGTGTLETVIPLGYDSAVVGSTMTFAVDTRRYPELIDSEDIYALELVDDVAGETQDLLEGAYTCTAYKKSDNNRFSLNIRYRAPQQQEVTTDCEEVRSTALQDGIYDLLGRPIRSNANAMPAGVYIVVRDGKAEKEVIR